MATRNVTAKFLATSLCALLVWGNVWAAWLDPDPVPPLSVLVEESYLDLLEDADEFNFSKKELNAFEKQLKAEKKAEKKKLENEEKSLKQEIEATRVQLAELNRSKSRDTLDMGQERADLHCQVLALEERLEKKQLERKQLLPVGYDNKLAKLELIKEWPAKKLQIENDLESARARERRYGDAEDIGIRVIKEGQEEDVLIGERAVREMKSMGAMPPEIDDPEVTAYVQQVAERIADHSDLTVPLQVEVLASDEINAFALPGGFLFVNSGLIEKAETESELAGVLAHEIAHVTARHGARLQKKANLTSILFQAAQMASVILTGGAAGIGTYYALQYGFMGLGMALNLTLLGVSRDFEQEADQLGAQYAWNAGYDPSGFITFFDKMASEKGYVKSASFFRTHPAFYERIVNTYGEITYLPIKKEVLVDTEEFQQAKATLQEISAEFPEPKDRPTLRRTPQCSDQEQEIETASVAWSAPTHALVW